MQKIVPHAAEYSSIEHARFSILIPSWNNLAYLKLCVRSILQNSSFAHQIIVIVNEGSDGTLEWAAEQKELDYVHAASNIGICLALNSCRPLIRTPYVVYANDDMYFLPQWDAVLADAITEIGHPYFMLSSTMIEPQDTGNPCVVVQNYGNSIENFEENKLLSQFSTLQKSDWNGSTWPPNIVPLPLWDLVGGMSMEFSPGMYSDPDLAMKLWQLGVRYFRGVGDSKVYHFGSKSTRRVRRNKGRNTFLSKWNMTSRFFETHYLRKGTLFGGALAEPSISKKDVFFNKIKYFYYLLFQR